MGAFANEIIPVTIEEELKQSYLDYAMSVIVGRALPDVRDGLKPVHRRVLFAMHELNNDWNKAYKKSARVVGDVIGKYHPHGESAVYDTIVRLAQDFTMRYLLIDGQGNFGSIDGDAPAAMRYTEIRMKRITHDLLADLDKETVDFVPNYDGTEQVPVVLPTRVPNLLINGSSGIAVGMATNIPPHNLGEVIDATIALIDKPNLSIDQLLKYIPGPDFPTAGIINGRAGIVEAYRTGRGRVYVRARTHTEEDEKSGKQAIIVTELPYQTNKARLIEKIAFLVKEKKVEGITGLRDESDKDGMRIVIELRRGENAEVVQNNLFAQTQLQAVFGINMVALVEGRPRTLNLKQFLEAFIRHRREVITRRTLFELRKARERAHLLEGLGIALVNIDPIIQLIKSSSTPAIAKEKLLAGLWQVGMVAELLKQVGSDICRLPDLENIYGMQGNSYRLSPAQAQAILDLRLHRLTGLEQEKIIDEFKQLLEQIKQLMKILAEPDELLSVMKSELLQVREDYADARRTEIIDRQEELTMEDLIDDEAVVVTLSQAGYVKTQSLDLYRAQRRGGRGKAATTVKEEDFIRTLLVTHSHATLLCFSSFGKVYWIKAYQLPQGSRTARGKPIVNLLSLQAGETITAILGVQEFTDTHSIIMATRNAVVKKVSLLEFSRPRNKGIVAIDLQEADQLIGVALTDGNRDIMLFSDAGKVVRFHENTVRRMGRTARGVRGMKLQPEQKVISLISVAEHGDILTATENGYGKRTAVAEHRLTNRGGQGVIAISVSERNGLVVTAVQVADTDEVMLMSDQGTLVRTRVAEISKVGRSAQGVRLINLSENEKLVGVQRIDELEEAEQE